MKPKWTLGAASSDDPIRFSLRSTSSAPVIASRTHCCTFDQRVPSTSFRHSAGVSGISRMALEPPSGKRLVQASSMVKGISGASQAVRRSNIRSITVRQARRRRESGRSQYRASLRMSKYVADRSLVQNSATERHTSWN